MRKPLNNNQTMPTFNSLHNYLDVCHNKILTNMYGISILKLSYENISIRKLIMRKSHEPLQVS